uniref:Kinase n=2 Tax=Bovine herpesvirus 4 TaxID=10385 RepID=A0A0F6N5B0_BHV4|nr:kinase [Bovine gammaherpesvirus 4]QJC19173.1 kinase [Bovine gammaherpesvirus 4]
METTSPMDQKMTPQETQSCIGDLGPSLMSLLRPPLTHSQTHGTIIEDMVLYNKHLSVCDVSEEKISLKVARCMLNCNHEQLNKKVTLGSGSFGSVRPLGPKKCVKTFFNVSANFYHELIMSDIIFMAHMRAHDPLRTRSLMVYLTACVNCQAIVLPRYTGSLSSFTGWDEVSADMLAHEFASLYNAIGFLNDECGIFHCDVSLGNILIDRGYGGSKFGKLVLGDFGISCFHYGNTYTNVTLKSPRGKVLYNLYSLRCPFFICADSYKPASILYKCYLLNFERKYLNFKEHEMVIGKYQAKVIDLAALGYCLYTCIEHMLDIKNERPSEMFYAKTVNDRTHLMYYLQFMAPKVVMSELLSYVWDTQIDLGLDSKGRANKISLHGEHMKQFRQWCHELTGRYKQCLLNQQQKIATSRDLKVIVLKLVSLDFFTAFG